MHHQMNPFLQHAVRHGQALMSESSRAVSLSQSIVSSCDEMIHAIHSGDIPTAVNTAQNVRIMAGQVAWSAQQLNNTLNERLEMASFVLNRIQFRMNELSGALQSIRSSAGESFVPEPWKYGSTGNFDPYRQTVPMM